MAGKKTTSPVAPIGDGIVTATVNGVEVTINVGNLDDIDALYQIRDLENGNIFAALDLIDLIVGVEQRKLLVNTVRDPETKRASVADFTGIVLQLFEAIPKP